mmetsp:Transcript_59424/g.92534  ORF Transcript_59424/g.92534 Transcript_59424/m.92534 type:complete len:84 (-) Transcript_59424:2226-2477(-)
MWDRRGLPKLQENYKQANYLPYMIIQSATSLSLFIVEFNGISLYKVEFNGMGLAELPVTGLLPGVPSLGERGRLFRFFPSFAF